MTRHVIIGRGNIGLDLHNELTKAGHNSAILTRSDGFNWPQGMQHIASLNPDCVWVAAGAGSVDAAKKNFKEVIFTHTTMPIELAQCLPPSVKLVLFSTDYAANENQPSNPKLMAKYPKSLYAFTKVWMEQALGLINRPNTTIVRVGTVYGAHYEARTFPGKIRRFNPEPGTVEIPCNYVCPTPSKWIAEVLARHYQDSSLFSPHGCITHHVGPSNGVPLTTWAQIILGEDFKVINKGFDQERPPATKLDCSLEHPPGWRDLWNSTWWKTDAKDNREAELLP